MCLSWLMQTLQFKNAEAKNSFKGIYLFALFPHSIFKYNISISWTKVSVVYVTVMHFSITTLSHIFGTLV